MEYSSLKLNDLRQVAKERGIDGKGKKQDIVDRLVADDCQNEAAGVVVESLSAEEVADATSGLDGTAMTAGAADGVTERGEAVDGVGSSGGVATAGADSEGNGGIDVTGTAFAGMSEKERAQLRKAKFAAVGGGVAGSGVVSEEVLKQRLEERARRFGIATEEAEEEKKKKRASRFGGSLAVANGTGVAKGAADILAAIAAPVSAQEEERRRSRSQRFGIVSEEEKIKKRKLRFGGQDEEAATAVPVSNDLTWAGKIHARELRFSGAPPSSSGKEVSSRAIAVEAREEPESGEIGD